MKKTSILMFVLFCLQTMACQKNNFTANEKTDFAERSELLKLPFKKIVGDYIPQFYIGTAHHARLLDGHISTEIADREFDYITPSNDFKQSYIHPIFSRWRWEYPDLWIEHSHKSKQVLRLHGPISPQCSPWAREDNRTREEMSRMLDEYMIALCKRYNGIDQVIWMDVVNETIVPKPVKDPMGDQDPGDWFGPRKGNDKWENPWTILGFDESTPLRVPLYIDRAFELANEHAPDIKQIINQHGNFEEVVWEKMKKLVSYLRTEKGRRIDGLGWQAHVDLGWEKIPGNLQRLDQFIQWSHQNNLEFHVTEMNVWIKDTPITPEVLRQQADTYDAILKVLLKNTHTGIVGLNFWNVRDDDTANPNWYGALWNNDGTPKPAYMSMKEVLVDYVLNNKQ